MVDRRVDRVERPRDEGVYSSRIQEDKKEKGKYSEEVPDDQKKLLMATFFSYLKKMFDSFSPSKNLAGKVFDLHSIIETLQQFRELLKQLSTQDFSNDPDFVTALSKCWSQMLTEFDRLEALERKQLQELSTFRNILDEIKNYPPDSDHRLGYYLLQHAGKDWLPFPFIEMLETLHKEHIETPSASTLSQWFAQIDTVIEKLNLRLPFKRLSPN